jgi:serine/threonine protein kinase
MNIPQVIGEGTYGCVHNPSLHCENSTSNSKINYKNKVSKFMHKTEAIKEMKEYSLIKEIDKNKDLYTGNPTQCNLEKEPINTTAIKNCQLFNPKTDLDNYSLLIMENGGYDLSQFAKKMQGEKKTKETQQRMELFWINAHHILYGLKIFAENDVVHHDLKASNLVYNENENSMKFIDFGLMTTKTKIMKECNLSKYQWSISHFSFPFETFFLNKNEFMLFSQKSELSKNVYFYKKIVPEIKKTNSPLYIFLSYISNNKITKQISYQFLSDYYITLTNNLQKDKYDDFLHKSIDTIDSYGVSIAFLYVLKKTHHLMDEELVNKLLAIFYLGCSANMSLRTKYDFILKEYEILLEQSGLLKKYNKRIENNKVIHQPIKDIQKKIHKISSQIDVNKTKKDNKIDDVEYRDIIPKPMDKNQCPDGKELNPNTNKCVSVCKSGKVRNTNFRCVLSKPLKNKTMKQCPDGKELNPKTNRCIKIKTRKVKETTI